MEKTYDHKKVEEKIYQMWEKGGYFKPKIDKNLPAGRQGKKPFTIVLPLPNASGKMHTGNVLMIAIEDLLIRWHRMRGDPTLWIPGTDHAGMETQVTYERELNKQGKSRLQFTRQELYQNIWDFVQSNKHLIEGQIRRMGASVDWSRYTFSLDKKVIDTVYETFRKMVDDKMIYRGEYIVNYCIKCGTTYADVELTHEERREPLYYVRYKLIDSSSVSDDQNKSGLKGFRTSRNDRKQTFISVATVRPEPIAEDTHLAVHPKDKKHNKLIGAKVINPLTGKEMEIIGDEFVDPKFGTGIVKLTPAVDKNDYEVALKHNLPIVPIVDLSGKMKGRYEGLSITEARKRAIKELQEKDLIEKIDENYVHTVTLCKVGHMIEPMVLPNWFVKVDAPDKSFKKPAYEAVKNGQVKIFPKWREITYLRWMEEMRDWPVSRQNVWGIRIPVWYKVDNEKQNIRVSYLDNKGVLRQGFASELLSNGISLKEIKQGLQKVFAVSGKDEPEWMVSPKEPSGDYLPETDTFDTWFSSGQWPLVTLGYPDSEDFRYFYPTSVLETGWEIIRLWVSRMIMFGIYLTDKPPFEYVYLHGMVRALDGRKMSKSLGNVINPDDYMEQYGVDALRMGLISGTANGKDFAFPKDRVIAYKHFANKIWNMARFMLMLMEQYDGVVPWYSEEQFPKLHLSSSRKRGSRGTIENSGFLVKPGMTKEDEDIIKGLQNLVKSVNSSLEKFRFADAGEAIYQFMWHELADKYIEHAKTREDKDVALSVLRHVYINCLKLLHPFMPFVTEEIYSKLRNDDKPLIISSWPL